MAAKRREPSAPVIVPPVHLIDDRGAPGALFTVCGLAVVPGLVAVEGLVAKRYWKGPTCQPCFMAAGLHVPVTHKDARAKKAARFATHPTWDQLSLPFDDQ